MSVPHDYRLGGVEGKWEALNKKLEEQAEKSQHLEAENARLRAATSDDQLALGERLSEALAELEAVKVSSGSAALAPNEEEQELLRDLIKVFHTITKTWKLRANRTELTIAVHTLQGFVLQHILQRVDPDNWGKWYED